MENFKEIAEKCLAGELSGTFILYNGKEINSEGLIRSNSIHFPYTFFDKPFTYTNKVVYIRVLHPLMNVIS